MSGYIGERGDVAAAAGLGHETGGLVLHLREGRERLVLMMDGAAENMGIGSKMLSGAEKDLKYEHGVVRGDCGGAAMTVRLFVVGGGAISHASQMNV